MLKERISELEKKEIAKISIGLIVSLIVVSGGFLLYLENIQVEKQSQSFNVSYKVIDSDRNINKTNLGLKTGNTLQFGEMPMGTGQRRYINWSSSAYTLARVSVDGNASEYLDYDSLLVFQGDKTFRVEMQAENPGYYEGQMNIKFEAPRTRWALKWLEFKRKHFY